MPKDNVVFFSRNDEIQTEFFDALYGAIRTAYIIDSRRDKTRARVFFWIAAILLTMLLITACASPYVVHEATDKFSDPQKPAIISMDSNSIDYHDPLGMVRTSELNGFVSRDRSTGRVVSVGFNFFRVATDSLVAMTGQPKWLSIQPGDDMIFIADGERLTVRAISADIDHKTDYNMVSGLSTDYMEVAAYTATPDTFKKIAFAKTLEFQAVGRNGKVSFPTQGRSLLSSFQANLRTFYNTQIATK